MTERSAPIDTPRADASELVTYLQGNSAIEKVRFAGAFPSGLAAQQDQLALLEEEQVGQLESLKESYIGNASIQASLLRNVVEAAKDLQVFSLGSVC
jgi:hypothetical protein